MMLMVLVFGLCKYMTLSLTAPGILTSPKYRICYLGADCYFDASVGIWALYLKYDASGSGWNTVFCLIYRICYRGGGCSDAVGVGIWALGLTSDASTSGWNADFQFNIEFVIAVLSALTLLVLVFWVCTWTAMSIKATGVMSSA